MDSKSNIAALQEQVDYFEGKKFILDKIKDDNDALSFYTGFQNYGIFILFSNISHQKRQDYNTGVAKLILTVIVSSNRHKDADQARKEN